MNKHLTDVNITTNAVYLSHRVREQCIHFSYF